MYPLALLKVRQSCHTPHLLIGVDQMIAFADLAVGDRALVDHEVDHIVEPIIEHRIVQIEVPRNITAKPGLERFGREVRIGLHLGAGIIHG